jgi:Lon protease-like protein
MTVSSDKRGVLGSWSLNDAVARSLLYCGQCHDLLSLPVTTRCGRTYCRTCILDQNLLSCPGDACRQYSANDCPVDFVLQEVIAVFEGIALQLAAALEEQKPPEHQVADPTPLSSAQSDLAGRSKSPDISTPQEDHGFALNAQVESLVNPRSATGKATAEEPVLEPQMQTVIDAFKTRYPLAIPHVHCQICSEVFVEPVTTQCGHTFCRHCLARSLDNSLGCPTCRTELPWPFPEGEFMSHDPLFDWTTNATITKLIETCWADELDERRSIVHSEEKIPEDEIPVFVCCLSYPQQPTFLRIFEPRYRLMLRRVLESPSKCFGMVGNSSDRVNSTSPRAHKYGTILKIEKVAYTRSREILLRTVGQGRFRVDSLRQHEGGYWAGNPIPLEDLPSSTESATEAGEVGFLRALDPSLKRLNFDPEHITLDWTVAAMARDPNVLSRLMTKELMAVAVQFIQLVSNLVPEPHRNIIIRERGDAPEAPAEFTWWFVSAMSIDEEDGAALLQEDSVRERMKLIVRWTVKKMQPQGLWGIYGRFRT